MFSKFTRVMVFCSMFCAAILLAMVSGCSPAHYKEEADREVYRIIEDKWQEGFGERANYTITDAPPSPNDIQVDIDKAIPASGVLSLAQAVAIATAHNRDYQTQKEQLYLTALDLTLARHQFARQWFGTLDARYVNEGEEEKVSSGSEAGFKQLLADGAAVSTSIAIDWAEFLTGDPRTTLGSILKANINQPLLRGSGRKVVQEKLTQAERQALYQIRTFSRYRKSFVVSIVNDYYRVLQQRDAVTNAENNYKRVAESKKRLELEADVGRRPRFEVDQAEQDVLKARDNLVRAQQAYQQRLDEFKIRLALPTDAQVELDQNELEALRKIGISKPGYSLHQAVETALVMRLDLANSADRIDDRLRKVMVAADGLGAELNLTGSATVTSTEQTDYTRLMFHRGTYGLGLEGDLPLDRKVERNAYREALIRLEQLQRQYENDVAQVKLDVRGAYRQLKEAEERYYIQKNSLELARKRVESTQLLLETGRAKTRDLLDSQDALLRAENDVTSALVDHAIAKLSFFRDIGVLQVKPDGMWKEEP